MPLQAVTLGHQGVVCRCGCRQMGCLLGYVSLDAVGVSCAALVVSEVRGSGSVATVENVVLILGDIIPLGRSVSNRAPGVVALQPHPPATIRVTRNLAQQTR